jgi:hypothetical protein
MTIRTTAPLVCIVWAGFLPCRLFAQVSTGALSGLVVDPSGATIGNADISLVDSATLIERRAVASGSGAFTLTFVRPGRYTLTARHDGFAPAQINDILLNVGDDVSLKITLLVGSRTDTVTVVDKASTTTKAAGLATVVDREFVENLPMNGRSFQSVIQLTPGVVPTAANTTQQGQFSVNGSRESANNFSVDGVSANLGISPSGANFNGASGQFGGFNAVGATTSLVSLEAMQEFTVQTSGFAPEYGRTPGGQISIVTRSGSNSFTGTVFEYFRHDRLNANDFFANSRNIARQKLRNNEFGGVLGGPIRRNTTFFFGSFEALRQRLPVIAILDVPSVASRRAASGPMADILNAFPVPTGPDVTATGLAQFAGGYSTPASSEAASLRIDHTIAGRFTVFGRYNYAPSEAATRGASSNSLSVLVPTTLKTQTLTLGATMVFTPRLLNDLRVNISRNTGHQIRIPDTYGGATVPNPAHLFPDFASPENSVVSIYTRGVGTPPALLLGSQGTNSQRQWNLVDTVSFHHGSHQFKLGVDHRRLAPLFNFVGYQQTVNFPSIAATVSGSVLSATIQSFKGPFYPRFTNLSLFAQDTWLVAPRLTLTYGVRYELNPAPSERDGNLPRSVIGVESPATIALAAQGAKPYETRYNNFAPRAGMAYILSQRPGHETVLRGGVGIFYDIASTQTGAAYRAFSYPYAATRGLGVTIYPFSVADASIPAFTTAPPYSLMYGSDPHLKLPYTVQLNAGVEQSLSASSVISATYTGSTGRRLYRTEFYQNQVVNFSGLRVVRNLDYSDYHGLQVQYRRRLSHDVQVLAHYTLSKSLDTSSSEAQMYLPVAYSPVSSNRGTSDFDRRHSFALAASYGLPKALHTGVWLDATYRALSASPVDVLATSSPLGVNLRPDLIPGQPVVIGDPAAPGGLRYSRAAFLIRADNNGTLGRNVLRGFPLYQLDLAARREFRFERLRFQARAEAFNLFNHTNLANPIGTLTASTFGTATQMLNQNLGGLNALYQIGGPRSFQLVVKVQF